MIRAVPVAVHEQPIPPHRRFTPPHPIAHPLEARRQRWIRHHRLAAVVARGVVSVGVPQPEQLLDPRARPSFAHERVRALLQRVKERVELGLGAVHRRVVEIHGRGRTELESLHGREGDDVSARM